MFATHDAQNMGLFAHELCRQGVFALPDMHGCCSSHTHDWSMGLFAHDLRVNEKRTGEARPGRKITR